MRIRSIFQTNFLIKIQNASVFLHGTNILTDLNWVMHAGENWAVVGNNGAGKTTFMKLAFGELIPKFWGKVYWFGKNQFQTLESVRKYIGFVSAEYQENYRQTANGQEVVESGFFSSIGLLLGQLAETWDQLATMQNFFLTPLSFLGGIFYSIKMLPEWAQEASFFNPIYYMINGLRYTILGVADSEPNTSLVVAVFMTIGFTLAAILLMKSGKKIKQ